MREPFSRENAESAESAENIENAEEMWKRVGTPEDRVPVPDDGRGPDTRSPWDYERPPGDGGRRRAGTHRERTAVPGTTACGRRRAAASGTARGCPVRRAAVTSDVGRGV
ncbi:hypothetical protein GCM10018953_27350 [Streptosporangium nondiastaticum]